MTTTTQELIETYAGEFENDLGYRSERSPRRMTRRSTRPRRTSGARLGINGRSTRRSTFKSMKHGEITA